VHLSIFISVINQYDAQFFFYNKFISCLYMFRAYVLIIRRSVLHYTASGIITPTGGRLVHETAAYRCNDTRAGLMQFWPHDDEHMCSKHVEAWHKLIVKQIICASSWLVTEINIFSMFMNFDCEKNCSKLYAWLNYILTKCTFENLCL